MISSANHIGSVIFRLFSYLPHVIVDNVYCYDSESGYQIEETCFCKGAQSLFLFLDNNTMLRAILALPECTERTRDPFHNSLSAGGDSSQWIIT
jgi:hypothetical protein